jgi:hypothetical protein
MEFSHFNSGMARLSQDLVELKGAVGRLKGGPTGLAAKVEALPRAIAEAVVEVLAERDRKR